MKKLLIRLTGFILLAVITFYAFKNFTDKPVRKAVTNEELEIPFTVEGDLYFLDGDTEDTIQKIIIEVADTPEETSQGLMHRSRMDEEQGMLFIFEEERMQAFYMKNTRISLDLLYVNSEKEIVTIRKYAIPYDLTSIPSTEPAQYVVEVIGGYTDKYEIEVGDKISYTLMPS